MCYHKPFFSQKEKMSKFLKRKIPYEPNNRYKYFTALLSINFSKNSSKFIGIINLADILIFKIVMKNEIYF